VVDIGAAFGLISVAMSKAVSSQGRVYAFEPSRNTQKFLQQVLALNDIQNVTIVQSAISDRPGTADFIEYTDDNELSWASDASTLAVEAIEPTLKHRLYQVEVTTIDRYITTVGIQPQVIKIDIEGFELYALHGGRATLQKFSPYLCIDIHTDVRTGESALIGVEPYLLELGYELHMEGHALYCTPKNKLLD
jgi:FkbM family methyltransferase